MSTHIPISELRAYINHARQSTWPTRLQEDIANDTLDDLVNHLDNYVRRQPISTPHTAQHDVEEFHQVILGLEPATTPAIRRPELRARLINEEASETVQAILDGDLVAAIDGLCDLLYVTYGTASEFGVDIAPYWDAVHASNMLKAGGPTREDGKQLKPHWWTGPDIAGILARTRA